jgi:hypothetical protein
MGFLKNLFGKKKQVKTNRPTEYQRRQREERNDSSSSSSSSGSD